MNKPTTKRMLTLSQICSGYGMVNVLKSVNLHIDKGEIVTLIGSNGAGKTTLLMTIFGTPRAASGEIIFNESDIGTLPTYKIGSLGIALVPEGRRIFPKMSVEENLRIGAVACGVGTLSNSELDHIYDLFPILGSRRRQRAGTLSGGEQQMLAIGRALMAKPQLLLLDEPSLGLAPIIVQQIFDIIKKIRQEGTTIFLVEQNAHQALNVADRAYVLAHGEIVLEGESEALKNDPHVRGAYLGQY